MPAILSTASGGWFGFDFGPAQQVGNSTVVKRVYAVLPTSVFESATKHCKNGQKWKSIFLHAS